MLRTDFSTWTHGYEQLKLFLKDLNQFNLNLKLTQETSWSGVTFLDLNESLTDAAIFTAIHIKPTDYYRSYIINYLILTT